MEDIVSYAVPFGVIGRIVNRFIISKKIKEIFSIRSRKLEELFYSTVAVKSKNNQLVL